jgi:all-trans-retinol dehydrogenase (NAD+)
LLFSVIHVLSKTIFSPFFAIFIPLSLLSQVKSTSHPAYIASYIWAGLVCLICKLPPYLVSPLMKQKGTLQHIDRVYASGGNWLLAPPKLNWGEQIVLITGGELSGRDSSVLAHIITGGSGIGALLAETLALRNVSVIVLTKDAPKYETDTRESLRLSYRADIVQNTYLPIYAMSRIIRRFSTLLRGSKRR